MTRRLNPAFLKRHAGGPHDHHHRLLLEALLVGGHDLVEPCGVVGFSREHDLHDLARLAHDLAAGAVPPLAGGIEHGEPAGEAGDDLAIDEPAPIGFVHPEAAADVAAEHQFPNLARPLPAEASQTFAAAAPA